VFFHRIIWNCFGFRFSDFGFLAGPEGSSPLYNWRNVQRANAWRLGSGLGRRIYKGLDPSKVGSKVGMRNVRWEMGSEKSEKWV